MRFLRACCLLLLAVATTAAAAPDTAPRVLHPGSDGVTFDLPETDTPPVLDGRLDEPIWRSALVLSLDYEVSPGENVPAPVPTRCYLARDARFLYVAFDASDPEPAAVIADLADRDDAWESDFVGIYLDTFHDHRRAYGFWVSAGGVQMDFTRNELAEDPEDDTWDARWHSAAALADDGYRVEMAIPFDELRFPRAGGGAWGFQARRVRPRSTRQEYSLLPEDRADPCLLCQAVTLRGLTGLETGTDLTVTPTWTAGRTDGGGFPSGDLDQGDWRGELGVSARWGLTTDLNLDAALNPDFSQVEADELQLDINERFALEYEEKRPFFLEGADIFQTPLPAVYTRTMNDPDWGLKLAGKQGQGVLGAMVVRDASPSILLAGNASSLFVPSPVPVTTGIVRYRRDLGQTSTVGVLGTAREGDGYHNRVGGLDGVLRWRRSHRLTWQWLWSDTRDRPDLLGGSPPSPSGDGSAGLVRYDLDGRDWSAVAEYRRLEPSFRQDTGFFDRLDLQQWQAGLWRLWWGDAKHWFNMLGVGATWGYGEDLRGRLTDRTVQAEVNYAGPLHSRAWLAVEHTDERYAGLLFGQQRWYAKVGLRPEGHLWLWLKGWGGDAIDTDNIRPATEHGLGLGGEYNPSEHTHLELSATRVAVDAAGGDLFTAWLAYAQARYHFDRRSFLRVIVQYRRYDQAPGNYLGAVPELTEQLFSQFLFSYKLDPQTLLFVGATATWLGLDPGAAAPRIDPTLDERTVFLKLSYAWRP